MFLGVFGERNTLSYAYDAAGDELAEKGLPAGQLLAVDGTGHT